MKLGCARRQCEKHTVALCPEFGLVRCPRRGTFNYLQHQERTKYAKSSRAPGRGELAHAAYQEALRADAKHGKRVTGNG